MCRSSAIVSGPARARRSLNFRLIGKDGCRWSLSITKMNAHVEKKRFKRWQQTTSATTFATVSVKNDSGKPLEVGKYEHVCSLNRSKEGEVYGYGEPMGISVPAGEELQFGRVLPTYQFFMVQEPGSKEPLAVMKTWEFLKPKTHYQVHLTEALFSGAARPTTLVLRKDGDQNLIRAE